MGGGGEAGRWVDGKQMQKGISSACSRASKKVSIAGAEYVSTGVEGGGPGQSRAWRPW